MNTNPSSNVNKRDYDDIPEEDMEEYIQGLEKEKVRF
jgi:hypothetical protein